MKKTIEILEKAENNVENHAYVVLTLSGFNPNFTSPWHQQAKANAKKVKDPYVREAVLQKNNLNYK